MSNKLINFEIVTPERTVLKEKAVQITVPTESGEITVLPDHIPLVSILQPGVVEIEKENGEKDVMSLSGGFIEVLTNKVVILADTAERAEEIDLAKAEEAKKRAEDLKNRMENDDDISFADINATIARELARTHAVKRWKKIRNIKK